ncbi:contact-dependent growth inhibition system immunity protein [Maribacter aquivivus]|uniref:contact-dependent growth inhibition system immunity protein n=1 Tax=Maribacter aquivivus TaxID=228958 RepID=UPI002490D571|nr:contact-dependent growth inhibition system immunity protein [Maribacter aquivivus]
MKKSIGTYQLGEIIIIHPKKGTESVAVLAEPIYQLNIKESPSKIGSIIRRCIEAYIDGDERYDKEKWKKVNDPLVKLTGLKNSNEFFKNVLNPQVVLINGVIHFCPRENHGIKKGFKKTDYPNIELDYSNATDEDLGNALLKALELSSIK